MWSSLLPKENVDQKYIYVWNNSHRKLTGNLQNNFCPPRLQEVFPHRLDRKKSIRLRPVPLGGDSEERRNCKRTLALGSGVEPQTGHPTQKREAA